MNALNVFKDRSPAEKRWVALAYVLLTATMVLAIASIVIYVTGENNRARQREADREEQVADARYSVCVGYNVEQAGDRDSVLNIALVTFGLAEAGDLSAVDREVIVSALPAEQQERYRQVEQQAALDNPFRDCSPAGIREYYDDPTLDPGAISTSTVAEVP